MAESIYVPPLDKYLPRGITNEAYCSSLVIFVHGGAWRSGDKSEHASMAQSIADATRALVAVPNYRLSPAVKHPVHTDDIQAAILHLIAQRPSSLPVHLIGHSVGTHIISTLLLSPPRNVAPVRDATPNPLVGAITSATLLEGIYDVDLLLRSFPTEFYRTFVHQALGERETYASVDVSTFNEHPAGGSIRWLVVHSKGDTLVDLPQAWKMLARLKKISGERARGDFTSLTQEHDEVLSSEELVELIQSVVVQR